MARLRQQYPQNYRSSGNISAEFENVMRYLNAAELGNKTIGELLGTLFDGSGEWAGPIELRRNLTGDLEYRVGEYIDADAGWLSLVAASELRGASGVDFGEIGAPVLVDRLDTTPVNGTTVVEYAHEATDALLVYLDGILKVETTDYTSDPTAGTNGQVTFVTPLDGTQLVTIQRARGAASTGYTRTDTETLATQAVFPFVHEEGDVLHVYLNGILQRAGGSYDYVSDPLSDSITFTSSIPAGNTVSIITVEDANAQLVTGLMTEANFVDAATGLILLSKVGIADDALPQAKVSGLAPALAASAKITAAGTAPVTPATTDLWLDTSQTPNQLKFYDGVQWLATAPDTALPTFTTSQANQALHINATGTALEFKAIDFSSLVAKTQMGAANGVATLNSSGVIPQAQLPSTLSTDTLYHLEATAANGSLIVKRIFLQTIEITGISIQTSSGTCDVQIAINGVGTGSTYAASTTTNSVTLGTPIAVDSTAAPFGIGVVVSNNVSAANLEIMLAINVVTG